jgi:hypothetical protein
MAIDPFLDERMKNTNYEALYCVIFSNFMTLHLSLLPIFPLAPCSSNSLSVYVPALMSEINKLASNKDAIILKVPETNFMHFRRFRVVMLLL